MSTLLIQPYKIIRDRRLAYLTGLEAAYVEMGYVTKLDGRCNVLEIYPEGTTVPKTEEEQLIEKWIS